MAGMISKLKRLKFKDMPEISGAPTNITSNLKSELDIYGHHIGESVNEIKDNLKAYGNTAGQFVKNNITKAGSKVANGVKEIPVRALSAMSGASVEEINAAKKSMQAKTNSIQMASNYNETKNQILRRQSANAESQRRVQEYQQKRQAVEDELQRQSQIYDNPNEGIAEDIAKSESELPNLHLQDGDLGTQKLKQQENIDQRHMEEVQGWNQLGNDDSANWASQKETPDFNAFESQARVDQYYDQKHAIHEQVKNQSPPKATFQMQGDSPTDDLNSVLNRIQKRANNINDKARQYRLRSVSDKIRDYQTQEQYFNDTMQKATTAKGKLTAKHGLDNVRNQYGVKNPADAANVFEREANQNPEFMDYVMGYHVPQKALGAAVLYGAVSNVFSNKGRVNNSQLYNPY